MRINFTGPQESDAKKAKNKFFIVLGADMKPTNIFSIICALIVVCIGTIATASDWKQYRFEESGFSVSLPLKPTTQLRPLPSPEGWLRIYQAPKETFPPTNYSVFVGLPKEQGFYEPDSIDAYLVGHLKGMMQAVKVGNILFSRRIIFHGQPAMEYQFSHQIDGFPLIARGITLMIDGGHMRVSMQHMADDKNAEANFKRFIESFQLIPVTYHPADKPFSDSRGITFFPPSRWVAEQTKNSLQVAYFTNLTRSMQLLVAGTPTYTCEQYQDELQGLGHLQGNTKVKLSGRSVTKLTTFGDLPKYQVRLTTVHYCSDSRYGAVVFTGTEEESMFPRWEKVFEGSAASIRVP